MLAKPGTPDVFNRKSLIGFIFEPKFDGTRVMIYKDGDDIELLNRKDEDIIRKYPEFLDLPNNIKAKTCVLDAEIVILDEESKPSLALLEEREQLKGKRKIDEHIKKNPATIFVFDILYREGSSVTELSLEKRKQELKQIIMECPLVKLSPFTSNGAELWQRTQETGIEGVMAKDLSSKYEQNKRVWTWLKIKRNETTDVVIAGYSKGQDNRTSLILSCFQNEQPVIVGKVEDMEGFDKLKLKKLTKAMDKLKLKQVSFINEEERKQFQDTIWLKPELVAEVKFSEFREKHLKEPSFLRLRFDKKPEDCVIE